MTWICLNGHRHSDVSDCESDGWNDFFENGPPVENDPDTVIEDILDGDIGSTWPFPPIGGDDVYDDGGGGVFDPDEPNSADPRPPMDTGGFDMPDGYGDDEDEEDGAPSGPGDVIPLGIAGGTVAILSPSVFTTTIQQCGYFEQGLTSFTPTVQALATTVFDFGRNASIDINDVLDRPLCSTDVQTQFNLVGSGYNTNTAGVFTRAGSMVRGAQQYVFKMPLLIDQIIVFYKGNVTYNASIQAEMWLRDKPLTPTYFIKMDEMNKPVGLTTRTVPTGCIRIDTFDFKKLRDAGLLDRVPVLSFQHTRINYMAQLGVRLVISHLPTSPAVTTNPAFYCTAQAWFNYGRLEPYQKAQAILMSGELVRCNTAQPLYPDNWRVDPLFRDSDRLLIAPVSVGLYEYMPTNSRDEVGPPPEGPSTLYRGLYATEAAVLADRWEVVYDLVAYNLGSLQPLGASRPTGIWYRRLLVP